MPAVNFYLKKADGTPPRSLIYLQFKYHGQKLVYSFGQKIEPKNWNAKTQRVKSNKTTTEDGQYSLNDLLETLSKACMKGYNQELPKGIPSRETLKKYLDAVLFVETPQKKIELFTLFDRYISGEIKHKGKEKSNNTLQNYTTVKQHLVSFAGKMKRQITFDSINLDFFNVYVDYLRKVMKLGHNTIAKDITVIKTVMNYAVENEYTKNTQFRKKEFSFPEEATDAVYLTHRDLEKLFKHDFSGIPRLQQVVHLFLVGAYTGLRSSDFTNIKPENIVDINGVLCIKMITQKTKALVIIPCHPIVMDIFKIYESNHNRLPKSLSPQKFNEYIKEAAKAAGLTETGRLSTAPKKELWETISSHTCRRSFCSNLYLEGFPAEELMKISGHKTHAAFFKYIKVSNVETAQRLADHMQARWKANGMHVVRKEDSKYVA